MPDKSKAQITEELRVSWSSAFLFIFFLFFLFNLWQTIHERWFIEFSQITIGGEKLIDNYNIEVILIGLGIFAAIGLAFFIFRRKQTWRFITSMQLGILLISVIGVGTILGTLVFQNAPSENYIAFYSEPMFTLFRAMHLTDVFDAWWFLAFEVFLAISMIGVTIRTKPWSLGRLGPMCIHLGIVVIIIGAFYGTVGHIDAVLFFSEGEEARHAVKLDYAKRVYEHPEALQKLRQRNLEGRDEQGTFLGQAIFKTDHIDVVPEEFLVDLGGTVRMDKFEEVYYEEPFTVSLLAQGTRKDIRTGRETPVVRTMPLLDFRDEKPLVLDDGIGTVRIKAVYENYSRQLGLHPSDDGESMALISFEDVSTLRRDIISNRKLEQLFTFSEEMLEKPAYGTFTQISPVNPAHAGMNANYIYKLYYSWNRPDDAQLEELGVLEPRKPFSLTFATKDDESAEPKKLKLALGENGRIPGTGYTVELKEFYQHFTINQDEAGNWIPRNVSEYMMNPTVVLEIRGGDLEEPAEIYVTSGMRSTRDLKFQGFIEASGLVPDVVVEGLYDAMLVGETGELLIFDNGGIENLINVRENGYRFEYSPHKIQMLSALEKAEPTIIENKNDPVHGNYAVELEVKTDSGTKTKIVELMSKVSTFLDRSGMPYMEVRKVDDGQIVSEYTMLSADGQKNYQDPVVDRYFMRIDDKNELMFQVRGDYIKEWLSHVSVVNNGEVVRSHTIRVNEPLVFNDFYFYQSSYDPVVSYGEKPGKWYTYLRVTKDPGLIFVFLGIAMMTFGMIWAAYIGPRFRTGPSKSIIKND